MLFYYSSVFAFVIWSIPRSSLSTPRKTLFFHDFQGPTIKFDDPPSPENEILKFHDFTDFPWPVPTLFAYEPLPIDLNLGEGPCTTISPFHSPDSGLYLMDGIEQIFTFDGITQQNTYTGVDAVDLTNLLCTMTFWHTSSNSSKRFTMPNFSMMAPQWNFFSCESCKTKGVTPLVSSPKHQLPHPVSNAFLSLARV